MGTIREEVREQHLYYYRSEEKWLKPFLKCFDVTWGKRQRAYNTDLSVYLLKPEPIVTENYGFSQELLLVYAPHRRLEPRTLQAAESFLSDEPVKGRADKLVYLLVSEAENVQDWVDLTCPQLLGHPLSVLTPIS